MNDLYCMHGKGRSMKKVFSFVIAAALAAGNLTVLSSAAEDTDVTRLVYDGLEYTVISDSLLELSGCTDKTVEGVDIPAEIDGRAVTATGSVFSDCPELTEINVDDESLYLEDIDGVLFGKESGVLLDYPRGLSGDYAIPEGTRVIADSAFENAAALTAVTIPDSLIMTGAFAFKDCSALTGFVNGIPLTRGDSISGCTALKSLDLAEAPAQTVLTNLRIDGFTALESVTIPDSYILNESFTLRDCPAISGIRLPESSELNSIIISGCDKLSSVSLPQTYAGNKISVNIANCSGISALELSFDEYVNVTIEGLSALESLKLNESKGINYTVSGCESLESIKSFSAWYTGEIDFESCPKLRDIYYYEDITENCHIQYATLFAKNDITVHCMRSNTALQEYLAQYDISVAFIDDEVMYGDANCDGTVDLADVVLIMQYLANPDKYGVSGSSSGHITSQGMKNADVEGDHNGITNMDALQIQLFLLGTIDKL